ncbi:N-acetylmuramoyl-L-alanine amidase [Staphylococcus simulans]|uniref:N-acetylmuramoyl-L-alanine amidase n=1 Tax=Staphylococcus simulans TaxID=1286 RepID=UPI003CEF2A2C
MSEVWNGVPVRFDLLPIGTRRSGQPLTTGKPKFMVIHDTGNNNTTAQDNVNYYKNSYNIDWSMVASAHIFVDDKEAIICIPVTEKAWHVLYNTPIDNKWYNLDANNAAFGIEGCYFTDKVRTQKSLDNTARVAAYLAKFWKIDYKTEAPGHQDIQNDKIDPGNLLEAAGYGRDISNFDKIVAKYAKGTKVTLLDKVKSKPGTAKKVENPTPSPKSSVTYQEAISYMKGLKGRYIDFDKAWAFQCMDVAVDYVYHVTKGKVRMYGNAKDSIRNVFPTGWKVIENTPDYIPPVASIAVNAAGEFGHIGLVWSNEGGTEWFTILEQNWDNQANTPAMLRKNDYSQITHFIVPDFVNQKVEQSQVKTIVPAEESKNENGFVVNGLPPKDLVWSNTAYFMAEADEAGVSICKPNHNGVMAPTNETYNPGDNFFIYEIRNGWCRVYSNSNNGFVWYERLRIREIFKPAGGKVYANRLEVGAIPPINLKLSNNAYCEAVADKFGVTIADRDGNLKNEKYGAGQKFYVFESVNGWCRVYSPTNNGYVWHERLRITKVF